MLSTFSPVLRSFSLLLLEYTFLHFPSDLCAGLVHFKLRLRLPHTVFFFLGFLFFKLDFLQYNLHTVKLALFKRTDSCILPDVCRQHTSVSSQRCSLAHTRVLAHVQSGLPGADALGRCVLDRTPRPRDGDRPLPTAGPAGRASLGHSSGRLRAVDGAVGPRREGEKAALRKSRSPSAGPDTRPPQRALAHLCHPHGFKGPVSQCAEHWQLVQFRE